MICRFQLVNATLIVRATQNKGQIWSVLVRIVFMVVSWTVFLRSFYEDMKTCRNISFTKNAEDFTSNNFLKCLQVKKLKRAALFSYERKK